MLDDLYPCCWRCTRQELKATLTALATALQGRGKQLGRQPGRVQRLPARSSTRKVPELVDDLDKLGQVAALYNDAAPDLLRA